MAGNKSDGKEVGSALRKTTTSPYYLSANNNPGGCDTSIQANAAFVTTHGGTTQGQITNADKNGLIGLSSEQWSLLLKLLNTKKEEG